MLLLLLFNDEILKKEKNLAFVDNPYLAQKRRKGKNIELFFKLKLFSNFQE